MHLTEQQLTFVINHAVLPPKLPQGEDPEASGNNDSLLAITLDSAIKFRALDSREWNQQWSTVVKALEAWGKIQNGGEVIKEDAENAMATMGPGDWLAFHVSAQNAGLIMRDTGEHMVFESFEASPQAAEVMAAKGSLRRSFPGRAVSVPYSTSRGRLFCDQLASALHDLSVEQVSNVMAKSRKARSVVDEKRDTVDPKLVTDMLMSLLAGTGDVVEPSPINKRIRDDVCWDDELMPWRRSGLWLVVRVAIQRAMVHDLGSDGGRLKYKNFMIFLLSRIGRLALDPPLSCDILFAINAKIGRRALKLDSETKAFVRDDALEIATVLREQVESVWSAVRSADDRQSVSIISKDEAGDDAALSMHNSRSYLTRALLDTGRSGGNLTFAPLCPPRMQLSADELPKSIRFEFAGADSHFALADFERWVEHHLSTWAMNRQPSVNDCSDIARLIETYSAAATSAYGPIPLQISLMFLVILELWQVLDRMALKLYPLLQDYSPAIPVGFLDPLLLPQHGLMKRLDSIEQYLEMRRVNTQGSNPPMFADPSKNSFAVRYFDQSSGHKLLRQQIEADAEQKRLRKKVEWERISKQHASLTQRADELDCDRRRAGRGKGKRRHTNLCTKCRLIAEARGLSMKVDEWPLPEDEVQCKAAVFELNCPVVITAWRSATYHIINDLGRSNWPSWLPRHTLYGYPGLHPYHSGPVPRITLGSLAKSFEHGSHYRTVHFPTPLQSVLLPNGLQYQLYDGEKRALVVEQTETPSIHRKCVSPLPKDPYSKLQYAVDSTRHTSNYVLANQSDCPVEISLNEYIAFGSLRIGTRLQWLNILRELASPNLTFRAEAVHTLIVQAAWQAGPASGGVLRTAHDHFEDHSFCLRLLGVIKEMLGRIEANWKEDHSMAMLIALTLRLLSLSPEQSDVVSNAIQLLQKMRDIALRWARELVTQLHKITEGTRATAVQQRLLKIACLCRVTYNVDPDHVGTVLRTDVDVAAFIECAILIQDHCTRDIKLLPFTLHHYLLQDRKISHTLEGPLRAAIRRDRGGLDKAVSQIWPAFSTGSPWETLPPPNDRWVVTTTIKDECLSAQTVHYNILEGELLVDGKPLGRLPHEFLNHATFRRVFGVRVPNVSMADMPGMLYMTATRISGYQVYFGMRDTELIIRTKANSEILELIPNYILTEDLPTLFIDEYVHWLNVKTGELELRPLPDTWKSSTKNWRLYISDSSRWHMRLHQKQLVDIRSATSNSISNVLKPLENQEYVHVTTADDGTLEAELPRYKLHFSVNKDGLLESRELAASVDTDQSLGAMYGLHSRLVLRSTETLAMGVQRRSFLVPHGDVLVAPSGEHVRVAIKPTSTRDIRYFRYDLGTNLGRVEGVSTLPSRLYMAYLHAVTSFLLPDPLTGRTGTEESLHCLRMAASMPFTPLDEGSTVLLDNIAALTPSREFYPPHLQKMQQIHWHKALSQWVQHDDFVVLASVIIEHSNRLNMLYEGAKEISLESRGHTHLLERAKLRNSGFRPDGLGGGVGDASADRDYKERDRGPISSGGQRTFEISSLINSWPSSLHVTTDLWDMLCGWGSVSGYGEPFKERSYTDLLNLNLRDVWGSLYDRCRRSNRRSDQSSLMFLFSAISFGDSANQMALRTLLSLALHGGVRDLGPGHSFFKLRDGYQPDRDQLVELIKNCPISFESSTQYLLPAHNWEKVVDYYRRRETAFEELVENQAMSIADFVLKQWPCIIPSFPTIPDCNINSSRAQGEVLLLFKAWFKNRGFKIHISEVQGVLNSIYSPYPFAGEVVFPEGRSDYPRPLPTQRRSVCWSQLLSNAEPDELPALPAPFVARRDAVSKVHNAGPYGELESMISELKGNGCGIRRTYGNDLSNSLDALKRSSETSTPLYPPHPYEDLEEGRRVWESSVKGVLESICGLLMPRTTIEDIARLGGHWPSITPVTLLGLLSVGRVDTLTEPWKRAIVRLGKAITLSQRSERLLIFTKRNDPAAFYKEAENTGRENWDPEEYPDWLLMEVDNDFLIRPVQAQVAFEMISPSSGTNSVLQLNMGEGKSSVIIPMIATAIADGKQLARVIVLKALAKQMAHLLSQRLGGLVNRRIFSTPFSRKTTLDARIATDLHLLHEECKQVRGVLLAQPEHILSFKLIGIEKLSSGNLPLASQLLASHSWLQRNCRDILDESDEILDVRFQLIYTVGASKSIQGNSNRWLTIQAVFDLVNKHVSLLRERYPTKLELVRRASGSFPFVCFLGEDGGNITQLLVALVVEDIGNGTLQGLALDGCHEDVHSAVLEFVSQQDVDPESLAAVYGHFRGDPERHILLVLRGLLACNILPFCLERKRWLVNYGLDPKRKPKCLMAVPYRAKGVPSLNAEFGHPDVAIGLTCLSYYYEGLTDDQIRQCFQLLEKTDDPTLEYDKWEKTADALPSTLRQFSSVNLENEEQCTNELFPHLRYNKPIIDFYMSRVVFPRECKEFEKKLVSSGWDIPAEQGGLTSTTGFSGTNDSRYLLPLSIQQQDLPSLHATSARVLSYLMQPENRQYLCVRDQASGNRLCVQEFLRLVTRQEPPIRVLLDVGAQILELKNRDLAKEWMGMVPDVDAAIYFDENDEMVVMDREENLERFNASPFRNRLDRCLVYLDDVHTRGTDLNLPTNTRAAVTLGPTLTKDRLVQACMRLRKLGHGQNLMFFAPPEVHQGILAVAGKTPLDPVAGSDVVKWALEQTCRTTEHNQALWVNQGLNHWGRQKAHDRFSLSCPAGRNLAANPAAISEFLHVLREREARTLEELYGPATENSASPPITETEDNPDPTLQALTTKKTLLPPTAQKQSSMHEEQERELAHEMEVERQVQRPAKVDPHPHKLHPDVVRFAQSSAPPAATSTAFVPAFSIFRASRLLNAPAWHSRRFLATEDFARTVILDVRATPEQYLRPVCWVLTVAGRGDKPPAWVVISPHEADALVPVVRGSKCVQLRVFAPRVAKTMRAFDDLAFYAVARAPAAALRDVAARRMLGLFAGQLYLASYADYLELVLFLKSGAVGGPGRSMGESWRAFVRHVVDARRNGQGFAETHLGGVVSERRLKEGDFEGAR
ncbi:MAG: hypothetical protein M1839_009531 [Geoglossum umbratile]|nr:MAG: hypothetical protein M1839_009531 [Geoglossum umbratile]